MQPSPSPESDDRTGRDERLRATLTPLAKGERPAALLAFQILVTSLALVIATTIMAAAACLLSIGLSGWLFWKLVRVMGRMQAQDRQ